jgi:ribonucleoside-triphosphate reductase
MIKEKSKTLKKILKRNGTIEKFDNKKILNSLIKAGKVTNEFEEIRARKLMIKILYLAQQFVSDKMISVEDIADIIEEVLMSAGYKNTVKAYILYRDQQTRNKELTIESQVKLTNQYLKKKDWQVKENSNMGYSLQGLNTYS